MTSETIFRWSSLEDGLEAVGPKFFVRAVIIRAGEWYRWTGSYLRPVAARHKALRSTSRRHGRSKRCVHAADGITDLVS